MISIICDLTKSWYFLNRNLSSITRQYVYWPAHPNSQNTEACYDKNGKHSDVNINTRTDFSFQNRIAYNKKRKCLTLLLPLLFGHWICQCQGFWQESEKSKVLTLKIQQPTEKKLWNFLEVFINNHSLIKYIAGPPFGSLIVHDGISRALWEATKMHDYSLENDWKIVTYVKRFSQLNCVSSFIKIYSFW